MSKNDESDFDLILDSYKNMKSQNSFIENKNLNINKYENTKEKKSRKKNSNLAMKFYYYNLMKMA